MTERQKEAYELETERAAMAIAYGAFCRDQARDPVLAALTTIHADPLFGFWEYYDRGRDEFLLEAIRFLNAIEDAKKKATALRGERKS